MSNRWTYLFAVTAIAVVVPVLAQGPPPATQGAPAQGAPQGGRPGGPGGGAPGGRAAAPYVPSGPGRTNNPFTAPISADEAVITIKLTEFASLPDAGTP